MIIKWTFEDINPGQMRGTYAFAETSIGKYQLVFDSYRHEFTLYIHTPNIIGRIAFLASYNWKHHTINEMLIYMHRVIESYEGGCINPHAHICGDCLHLIFRDYRHHEGLCNIIRLHRNFEDICVNEDIAKNDRITNE